LVAGLLALVALCGCGSTDSAAPRPLRRPRCWLRRVAAQFLVVADIERRLLWGAGDARADRVVLVRRGARPLLEELFRSWGQPLSARRLASFTAEG